jgi:hypothetical protein
MPLHEKVRPEEKPQKLDDLKEELIEEWLKPSNDPNKPLIVMDYPRNKTHIFVVWDKWQSLGLEDRGFVIMSAYREVEKAETKHLNVSLVMGLTRQEAPRFGINPNDYV